METEHPRCHECGGLKIIIHEVLSQGPLFICKSTQTCARCGHQEVAEYHLSNKVVNIEVIAEVM